jgi:TRAP-type C4-dicarboxylate transport system permease small subunit
MLVNAAAIVTDTEPNALRDLECVFQNILRASIPLGAIVLFIFLLWAGYQFASSQDDPKKAAGAKSTLTYAIFGFIFLASAFLVILFVSRVLGTNQIESFQIFFGPGDPPACLS